MREPVKLVDRDELLRRYERRLELMVPAAPEDLRDLDIFKGFPEKARDKVVEKAREYIHKITFAAGETILREGDYGDSAYYILEGEAEVNLGERAAQAQVRGGAHVPPGELPAARPGTETMIGRASTTSGTVMLAALPVDLTPGQSKLLHAGEIFGEISALSRYPVMATVWRGRMRDELARTYAQIDPHSPRRWRVHGPLANSDAFQEAFGLADDAPILRAREDRIEIW